jgi:hypothetical protein
MDVMNAILKRVPPGDRWVYDPDVNNSESGEQEILESLTEAIEHCFLKSGIRRYFVNAEEGIVYEVHNVPDPKPPVYSIYGDYVI